MTETTAKNASLDEILKTPKKEKARGPSSPARYKQRSGFDFFQRTWSEMSDLGVYPARGGYDDTSSPPSSSARLRSHLASVTTTEFVAISRTDAKTAGRKLNNVMAKRIKAKQMDNKSVKSNRRGLLELNEGNKSKMGVEGKTWQRANPQINEYEKPPKRCKKAQPRSRDRGPGLVSFSRSSFWQSNGVRQSTILHVTAKIGNHKNPTGGLAQLAGKILNGHQVHRSPSDATRVGRVA